MLRWIPLMEYATKNGVSLSTLRRHIKANKIEYRVENGRYLLRDADSAETGPMDSAALSRIVEDIYASSDARPVASSATSSATSSLGNGAGALATDWLSDFAPRPLANANASLERARIEQLEDALRLAQEEIAELKTLVALYEERL